MRFRRAPHRGRDAFRCSLPKNVFRDQAGNEALLEIPGNTLRLRISRETGSIHEGGAKAGSALPQSTGVSGSAGNSLWEFDRPASRPVTEHRNFCHFSALEC